MCRLFCEEAFIFYFREVRVSNFDLETGCTDLNRPYPQSLHKTPSGV